MEDTVQEMLAAGKILNEVEWEGAMTLRQLIWQLNWPVHLVVMAIGVLVRQGLMRVTQQELEVIVEVVPEGSTPTR